ncbi:hypothetical protein BDW69DRAFT_187220 [Aspergillus filifer]
MANQETQCPRCGELGHTYGTCPEFQRINERIAELATNQNCKEFKDLRERLKRLIPKKESKKIVDEQFKQEERYQRRERANNWKQNNPGGRPKRLPDNKDPSTSETSETEHEQGTDHTVQHNPAYPLTPSASPFHLQTAPSSAAEQTPTPTTTPSPAPTSTSTAWSTPSTPRPSHSSTQSRNPKWHFWDGVPPPRRRDAVVGGYDAWYEPYIPPAPGESWNLTPRASSRTKTETSITGDRSRRSASPSPEDKPPAGTRRGYRR